jgi:hypothetical protein
MVFVGEEGTENGRMNTLELFSKDDCSLCDDAKEIIGRVNTDFHFAVTETKLTQDDPRFLKYGKRFPVLVASNGKEVWGKVTEEQIRTLFHSLTPPPRIYYVAKFLEALAIVGVFFGFMYGLMGDMWMDLYFFLGGIVIFLGGWTLEKWESSRMQSKVQS